MSSPTVTVDYVGMDVHVNFGDSRLNVSADIQAAHFVVDDERQPTETGSRQKLHIAFYLKMIYLHFCIFEKRFELVTLNFIRSWP